jgi:hypothetical protein
VIWLQPGAVHCNPQGSVWVGEGGVRACAPCSCTYQHGLAPGEPRTAQEAATRGAVLPPRSCAP